MAGLAAIGLRPLLALQAAQGALFPFVPVFLAFGVGLWFKLPFEPSFGFYGVLAALVIGLVALWHRCPELAQPPVVAVTCVLVGVLAIGLRAHMVEAPMLARP